MAGSREKYDEVIIAAVQALKTKIKELENHITEQQAEICDLKGHLMRKHTTGRVHTSSQTEAAPVFSIKPTPPKEGAPRKNTHHRRHKIYPQDGRSLDSCNEKVSSREVAVQTPPITCSHILPSNPQKGMRISIRLSRRRKRSRALHQDQSQRLTLSDGHDPQTAQPLTETLPPIPLTEAPPFHVLSGTGNVDMTPTLQT
ncbi:hypothetical protein ACROYT_G023473 [Oculina patagonica]